METYLDLYFQLEMEKDLKNVPDEKLIDGSFSGFENSYLGLFCLLG